MAKDPTIVTNPDGSTTVTDYDESGKPTYTETTVTNQDGTKTRTRKDSTGATVAMFHVTPEGRVDMQASPGPDGTMNMTQFTPGGGSTTTVVGKDGVPVAKNQTNPDGSTSNTYLNPDGSVKNTVNQTPDQVKAAADDATRQQFNDAQSNPATNPLGSPYQMGNALWPSNFATAWKGAANAVSNYVGAGDVAGGSGGGGSSSLTDAVNGVAGEAFKYADQNKGFQLEGLDKANAALDPAKQSYQSMYGPGGTLAGPGQGEQAFNNVGGNLLNQTEQSKALASATPFLSGQSPGMGAYQDVAGQLGGPTLSAQKYGDFSNQLGQQSAGEQRYAQTQGKYDTNALDQAAGGLNSKLNASTNLESNLSDIAGRYAAPSASATTYQQQSGQLAGPGALEQFAASDLNGTNPYYKQLADQQAADIDASFNARGGFNSGAAMKAQALGRSNLAAQQYQQEAALQGQAQSAQLQRLGQQQSAAGAADTQTYAGLAGQANTLSTADAQRLARTQSGIDLAGQQASTDLGYLQGGQAAANQAGAANLARTQAGIGLTQNTDATNLAQNLGYVNAANQAGAGQVSQYSALGNMAQGQDAASQAQYMNYLTSAAAAQKAAQDRQQQGFTDIAGLSGVQSGNTLTQYGKAGDEYASMVGAGMGAQLNAAQLSAQQQQNNSQNNLGYLGLLTKIATA